MKERIYKLAKDVGIIIEEDGYFWIQSVDELEKFAELIVKECKENFSKVWYEQGMDIRGAEIGKFLTRFDEHFGGEE